MWPTVWWAAARYMAYVRVDQHARLAPSVHLPCAARGLHVLRPPLQILGPSLRGGFGDMECCTGLLSPRIMYFFGMFSVILAAVIPQSSTACTLW